MTVQQAIEQLQEAEDILEAVRKEMLNWPVVFHTDTSLKCLMMALNATEEARVWLRD